MFTIQFRIECDSDESMLTFYPTLNDCVADTNGNSSTFANTDECTLIVDDPLYVFSELNGCIDGDATDKPTIQPTNNPTDEPTNEPTTPPPTLEPAATTGSASQIILSIAFFITLCIILFV